MKYLFLTLCLAGCGFNPTEREPLPKSTSDSTDTRTADMPPIEPWEPK